MDIPAIFLGTAPDVRSAMRRLATKIARGASIPDVLEASPLASTDAHPQALIWTNALRPTRPAASVDFRPVLLCDAFFNDKRIPLDRAHQLRRDATSYLETTAWGTVVLNSNQGLWWGPRGGYVPPCRRSRLAVIRGTYRHWETLEGIGRRYCTGHGPEAFSSTMVASFAGALASLGVKLANMRVPSDPSSMFGTDSVREDPRPLIEKANLIHRLEHDQAFWDSIVEREYGPLPTKDNLERIAGLCAGGTWKKEYWELLQREGGQGRVEEALEAIRQREDWSMLIGVFVHVLQDMSRASALYGERSDDPDIQWAREAIAEYQAVRDPEAAAALLFDEAEAWLSLGKKMYYRDAADKLEKARKLLTEAGKADVWKERIEDYRARHRGRRNLIEILDRRQLSS